MRHYRNSCIFNRFYLFAHRRAAFQLDRSAASFFHQSARINYRIIYRRLIGHEGHVDDNQSIFAATRYSSAVMYHVLHRYGQSVRISQDYISQRVAYEYSVYARLVHQLSRGIIVAGQHRDLLSVFFHFRESRCSILHFSVSPLRILSMRL